MGEKENTLDGKRIIEEVSKFTGVLVETIRNYDRTAKASQARRIAAYRMKTELGWSSERIARFLNREGGTIRKAIAQVERNLRRAEEKRNKSAVKK